MELINHTGFAAEFFRQFNLSGALNGVVAVRGTFDLVHQQVLSPSEMQEPFQWSDIYAGDPHQSHLITPSDFVPFKPGTDITILGTSYVPDGVPKPNWVCGVRIGQRLTKLIRVHGSRFWEPLHKPPQRGQNSDFAGWRLTDAESATKVPITWRKAFGGARLLATDDAGLPLLHPYNGLGSGLLDGDLSPKDRLVPAPQIEAIDEPIQDWQQDYLPQGFAPVPPWWRFRQRHVGTVDEKWIAERHPFLPMDFDYRFYQVAHPDLVVEPWLDGGEVIELAHLDPGHKILVTKLPGLSFTIRLRRPRQLPQEQPLILDGVHIDLHAAPPRVQLTWRTGFPCDINVGEIDLEVASSPLPTDDT